MSRLAPSRPPHQEPHRLQIFMSMNLRIKNEDIAYMRPIDLRRGEMANEQVSYVNLMYKCKKKKISPTVHPMTPARLHHTIVYRLNINLIRCKNRIDSITMDAASVCVLSVSGK